MPKLFWHEHPVSAWDEYLSGECDFCLGSLQDRSYYCNSCTRKWHRNCIPHEPTINHQSHPNHPLEFLADGIPDYTDGKCQFCLGMKFGYHCSICDFNVDVNCVKKPPELTINHHKCHEHTLTLMARAVSFVCNACGTLGQRNAYVCLVCSLMFHKECITLPRVINVNRHNHRVSYTHSLVHGDRICTVCYKEVDWRYGSYFCLRCPSFDAHSKCATRADVWDGSDLEGVSEEEKDISPFKVIGENLINHFSHEEHNLELIVDANAIDKVQSSRCEACVSYIGYEQYYSCTERVFLLHESCANFTRQMRHGLSSRLLDLEVEKKTFKCSTCKSFSNGFKYHVPSRYSWMVISGDEFSLDLRCASIPWIFDHPCHPHTLFLTSVDDDTCGACNMSARPVLNCIECEFTLCYECAILPEKIYHKCDDHLLSLCHAEDSSVQYWCEICEAQADPKKWFYTCQDCSVVCHIQCALGGDFANIKTGIPAIDGMTEFEVVLNGGITRPRCFKCLSRCQAPVILQGSSDNGVLDYACSFVCSYWESLWQQSVSVPTEEDIF
ncbi:unnamed protein product [Microthlaspi erraticum]|uniref:Phorbol-ester/DAG-type domain-containing protein n=1 Tax=Microthlaspi erraticum TaxID=1685480 RepID=A0A6D2INJ8_9BRAS|nr:unnamed protein product [Microthlaspi erraticum]